MPIYKKIALVALLSLSKVEASSLRGSETDLQQQMLEDIQQKVNEVPKPLDSHNEAEILKNIDMGIAAVDDMTSEEAAILHAKISHENVDKDLTGLGFDEEGRTKIESELELLLEKLETKLEVPAFSPEKKGYYSGIMSKIEELIAQIDNMSESDLKQLKSDMADSDIDEWMTNTSLTKEEMKEIDDAVAKLKQKMDLKQSVAFGEAEGARHATQADDLVKSVDELTAQVDTMTEAQVKELLKKMEEEDIDTSMAERGFTKEEIDEVDAHVAVLKEKLESFKFEEESDGYTVTKDDILDALDDAIDDFDTMTDAEFKELSEDIKSSKLELEIEGYGFAPDEIQEIIAKKQELLGLINKKEAKSMASHVQGEEPQREVVTEALVLEKLETAIDSVDEFTVDQASKLVSEMNKMDLNKEFTSLNSLEIANINDKAEELKERLEMKLNESAEPVDSLDEKLWALKESLNN